jgi:hypothetical protein
VALVTSEDLVPRVAYVLLCLLWSCTRGSISPSGGWTALNTTGRRGRYQSQNLLVRTPGVVALKHVRLRLSIKSVRQPTEFFSHKNQLAVFSANQISPSEQAVRLV